MYNDLQRVQTAWGHEKIRVAEHIAGEAQDEIDDESPPKTASLIYEKGPDEDVPSDYRGEGTKAITFEDLSKVMPNGGAEEGKKNGEDVNNIRSGNDMHDSSFEIRALGHPG